MNTQHDEAWWIDCDPGVDDVMALILAHAYKRNIVGISCSVGNTTAVKCAHNAVKTCRFLRTRYPVYIASQSPLTTNEFDVSDDFFGEDALGDSIHVRHVRGWLDLISRKNGHFAMIEAAKEAKEKG